MLGILSIGGAFLTGIPAFLLGMWALSDMRDRRNPEILLGKRMAITGAALGGFFSLVVFFALPLAVVTAMQHYQAQARQIGQLRERVSTHVRAAAWQEAAADYEKIIEIEPDEPMNWLRVAPLYVRAGDQNAYQDLSERMLVRFGDAETPHIAEKIGKACLLIPTNQQTLRAASHLAEIAIEDPSDWAIRYSYATHGLAQYRQGNFEAAIDASEKCLRGDSDEGRRFRAANAYLVEAMAYHELGRSREASTALEKGRDLVQSPPQSAGNVWHDDLICRILLDEAERQLSEP